MLIFSGKKYNKRTFENIDENIKTQKWVIFFNFKTIAIF